MRTILYMSDWNPFYYYFTFSTTFFRFYLDKV